MLTLDSEQKTGREQTDSTFVFDLQHLESKCYAFDVFQEFFELHTQEDLCGEKIQHLSD